MIYNSQNLPLSKKKIIKKTISSVAILPMFFLLIIFPIISLLSASRGSKIEYGGLFQVFLFFFIPFLLLLITSVIYQYLYYKYYYYNFEQDSAEIRKGVVANSTGHVRYSKIQNIFVDQDFFDRFFGLYDVHYETAGESSSFYSHVDGIEKENADKLTLFLNSRVANKDLQSQMTNEEKKNENSTNTESNDGRILNRDNVPIEKRIILLGVLYKTLIFSLILLVVEAEIIDLIKISESIQTFMFFSIVPIVLIGSYFYETIWYKNFYFKFDSQGGIIKEKVLSSRNTSVYFNRVQNIDIFQSIDERVLRLYRLRLETAAEGTALIPIEIKGLNKKNAEILKNFLLEKSMRYQLI
jgi:uncharacterized membrane protein YdbT with pleckstrin-like domain